MEDYNQYLWESHSVKRLGYVVTRKKYFYLNYKMGEKDRSARRWLFTLFKDENINGLVPKVYNLADELIQEMSVRYIVLQREKCPTTKKLHIQGYAEFLKPVRFSWIQRLFGEKCHCEIARGTQEQCINYCKKEETRDLIHCEYGEPSKASGGCDTSSVIAYMKDNPHTEKEEFIEKFEKLYLRCNNAMEKIHSMYYKKKSQIEII